MNVHSCLSLMETCIAVSFRGVSSLSTLLLAHDGTVDSAFLEAIN